MNRHPGIGALALFLAGVTLIASGCAGDGPRTSTAIYFGAQSTTATVVGVPLQADGHVQSGRGVVVEPGVVATACHVIEHRRPVVVLEERLPAEVVDSAADLCLMSIESEHSGLRPIDFGRAYELRAGETVYLIGSAGMEDSVFTAGEVVGLGPDVYGLSPSGVILLYSADVARGASGGAVLDERGRLLGLTVAKIGEVKLAIPVEAIESRLDR